MKNTISWRRLGALCRKETLQILRDPSSNIIAFVLPVLLLFIFGYGINLDSTALRIGLVLEDTSPEARHFAEGLYSSPYLQVTTGLNRKEMEQIITAGRVKGFVVVPIDFAKKLKRPTDIAPIIVVTDGAEPNTANFVQNYVNGIWNGWLLNRAAELGEPRPIEIRIESRFWFNASAESRNYIIPGSITIIMTVIGTLLNYDGHWYIADFLSGGP
jgi:ABC-2 type transport system permease protein